MPHCLRCCIWQERNARSFEGYERSMLELKSFFFQSLLEWSLVLPVLLDLCNSSVLGLAMIFNKNFTLPIQKKKKFILKH